MPNIISHSEDFEGSCFSSLFTASLDVSQASSENHQFSTVRHAGQRVRHQIRLHIKLLLCLMRRIRFIVSSPMTAQQQAEVCWPTVYSLTKSYDLQTTEHRNTNTFIREWCIANLFQKGNNRGRIAHLHSVQLYNFTVYMYNGVANRKLFH